MASSGPAASPRSRDGSDAALRAELKRFIVEHLRLPDVDPEALPDDAPLVSGGFDLDSIDVLELVTGVERRYGVRFEDPEVVQKAFRSVGSLASHLAEERGRA